MKKILAIIAALVIAGLALVYAGQQTSATTAATIIDRAQVILCDTNGRYYTDDKLLTFVNMGIQDIASKTKCMETTYPVLMQTGVTEYAIASGTYFFTINTAVHLVSGTTTYQGLKKSNPQSTGHIANPGKPAWWYQSGNNIGILPVPTSGVSGDTVITYLSQRPSAVLATDNIPTPAVYDNALIYFVVAQASYMDLQKGKGDQYMILYTDCLKFYRTDLEERPVEGVKEIIK